LQDGDRRPDGTWVGGVGCRLEKEEKKKKKKKKKKVSRNRGGLRQEVWWSIAH